MRLNHPDYIKLVIGTYKKKRANNELSLLLAQPTPGSIRQECYNVYQEGVEKKDEPTLRAFFGPGQHGGIFLDLIKNFDLSKFKPLDKYLKKEGNKGISDRSFELLAWLIGFKHRPFVYGKEVILSEEELSILNDIENNTETELIDRELDDDDVEPPGEGDEQEEAEDILPGAANNTTQDPIGSDIPTSIHEILPRPGPGPKSPVEIKDEKEKEPDETETPENPEKDKEKKRSKRALLYFFLFIICTGGAYIIWQQKQDKQMMAFGNPNTGCMYWTGDHYDTISCTDKQTGRLKLPLDLEKMRNFKRITIEDTITEKSIGILYYIRINGGREYYTAGGNHPVYVTRDLQVLSRYIFDKYLRKQGIPGNGSLAGANKKSITDH